MTKARAPRIGGKQWTAAGAARFARDARAQTVLHLAKAQTPVQWQVYGLTAGLDMWQRMYGDRRLATEVLLGPIGYPPPHTGTVTDYAQQLTRDTAAATAAASLFAISPTMHDVVVAAALTLSINDLVHVDETDPPTPAGLVVLPHAMLQVDAARDTADVRALLWSPITAYGPDGEQGPGLRVTAFLDANGPVRVATFDAFAEQARLRGEPLPPLVFDASQGLPFHYNKPVGPLVLAERALHVREQAERGRRAAEDTGHDASATVGEYTSGAPVDDTDESLSRRYLFAFWRLCEQHIAEITQAPLTHSAAATAARAGTSPQASVVTLRQRARVADQPATPSPYSGPRAGWCGCTKWTSGIPSSTPTASSGAAHTSKDPTGYPSNNPPSARWSVEPALRHAAADLCTARAAIRSCQAEILSSRAGRTSSAMTSPGSARHHSSSLANDVHG